MTSKQQQWRIALKTPVDSGKNFFDTSVYTGQICMRPKGPKYRFLSNIDFPKCRREIAAFLNDFSNRWCKRENVEPDALKE